MNAKLIIVLSCFIILLTGCCNMRATDSCYQSNACYKGDSCYKSTCQQSFCDSDQCTSSCDSDMTQATYNCDGSWDHTCCNRDDSLGYTQYFDNIGCNDFQPLANCNSGC